MWKSIWRAAARTAPAVAGVFIFALWGIYLGLDLTFAPTFSATYSVPGGASKTLQEVVFQIAIALGLAVIVGEIVERSYRRRFEEGSKTSLLKGVLGQFFDEAHIREAEEALLGHVFLRSKCEVQYRFSKHPDSDSLIWLDVITDYIVTNKHLGVQIFDPKLRIPHIFAHYPHDPIQALPELLSASIALKDGGDGGGDLEEFQLKTLNEVAQLEAATRGLDHFIFPLGRLEVPRDGSAVVSTHHRMPKLRIDTEVMLLNYPSDQVTIKIFNEVGSHLLIEMRPIHHKDFSKPKRVGKRPNEWKYQPKALMLPHNGWILYWNDTSTTLSGSPAASPP
ncbi:hypothetical protein [Sphingopyxis fribergensis]